MTEPVPNALGVAVWNRVTIKGLSQQGEVWSSGFAMAGNGGGDVPASTDELTLGATNIGSIIETWPTTNALRVAMSTSLSVTHVRIEARNEDETLLNVAEVALTPALQGNSSLSKPLPTCAVLSLRTATPGPRGRGRMYWPALTHTLDTAGRFASVTTIALITDLRLFLNAVTTSFDPGFDLNVVLRSGTDHQSRIVTSLRCGDVPDTQRRRRDNLVEIYASLPLP